MSFTPGAGSYGPGESREPREVSICWPVLGNVSFSKRDHLKLVSVGIFEKLNINPSATDQRVVAAGERQPAGKEVDVGPERQLVSTGPA